MKSPNKPRPKIKVNASTQLRTKYKFNLSSALAISLVIVASLGFIYILLSRAGSAIWNADDIQVLHGTRMTQANGDKVIQSVPGTAAYYENYSVLSAAKRDVSIGTYCATGTVPANTRYSYQTIWGYGKGGQFDVTDMKLVNEGRAGIFEICTPLNSYDLGLKTPYSSLVGIVSFDLLSPLGSTATISNIRQKSAIPTWYPDNMKVILGSIVHNPDGSIHIVGATEGNWSHTNANISSIKPGVYCATGTAPANSHFITTATWGEMGGGADPSTFPVLNNGAAGSFDVCKTLPVDSYNTGATSYFTIDVYTPLGTTSKLNTMYAKDAVGFPTKTEWNLTWGENITTFGSNVWNNLNGSIKFTFSGSTNAGFTLSDGQNSGEGSYCVATTAGGSSTGVTYKWTVKDQPNEATAPVQRTTAYTSCVTVPAITGTSPRRTITFEVTNGYMEITKMTFSSLPSPVITSPPTSPVITSPPPTSPPSQNPVPISNSSGP